MQNLAFLALTVPEIWRGSQNYKSRSRDPFLAPFDPFFLFLSLVLRVMNLHVKFDASSCNRSRDMEGGPKISKLGHVTLSLPVNEGLNKVSPVTPYLNSLTPTCLFTIQLSLGYDDD